MHQKRALNIVNSCYKSCVCEWANKENEFDMVVSSEVVNPISLHSLCRSNIGWFSDKSVCEHHVKD